MFTSGSGSSEPGRIRRLRPAIKGFLLGAAAGAALAVHLLGPASPSSPPAADVDITGSIGAAPASGNGSIYPADVLRVADGDSFEARVHVWPGIAITTMVRLRDVDTPELKGRCPYERDMARAARERLAAILAEGAVAVSRIGLDKYGGRVDAAVSTRGTPDVAAALKLAGLGRAYAGGRREGWCP
jgi:endonuclease YncB( thermonuclease family)